MAAKKVVKKEKPDTAKKVAKKKAVKKEEPEWHIVETKDDSGFLQEYTVILARDKKEKYPEQYQIGSISCYPSFEEKGKPAWKVSGLGSRFDSKWDDSTFNSLRFKTKEMAATVLFTIWKSIQDNPCPPDMADWLGREAQNLYKEEREIRNRFYDVRERRRTISRLTKAHNLDICLAAEEHSEAVKELSAFIDESIDKIYEDFGKDWARTLRALLTNVVEEVDPGAALGF